MPCCNVTINRNCKCDIATCIPTDGKSCLCICEKDGIFTKCNNCNCDENDCECKCDNPRCTCIVTNGAKCICVGRDEKGNIQTFNCCKAEVPCCVSYACCKTEKKCCQKQAKGSFGRITDSRTCLPTNGKSCICVCEDDGVLTRCDDCKCGDGKCDDSRCTCIVTNVVKCICVGCDEKGNIQTFNCCKAEVPCCVSYACCKTEKKCCQKQAKGSFGRITNSRTCLPTNGKSCICVCEDDGVLTRCDDCKCSDGKCNDSRCTCIVTNGAKCICVGRDEQGHIQTFNCCKAEVPCCVSDACCKTEKKCCQKQAKGSFGRITNSRTCFPTNGNSCICICEDDGVFTRCDDCKCSNGKCDDSRCTCIVTNGAKFICVGRDDKGNIQSFNCCKAEEPCCVSDACCKNEKKCCQKQIKGNFGKITNSRTCLQTKGKSCICLCENEKGDIVRCDDCKCCSSENTGNQNCDCCGKERRVTKDCCCTNFNKNQGNCNAKCCVDVKEESCKCCEKKAWITKNYRPRGNAPANVCSNKGGRKTKDCCFVVNDNHVSKKVCIFAEETDCDCCVKEEKKPRNCCCTSSCSNQAIAKKEIVANSCCDKKENCVNCNCCNKPVVFTDCCTNCNSDCECCNKDNLGEQLKKLCFAPENPCINEKGVPCCDNCKPGKNVCCVMDGCVPKNVCNVCTCEKSCCKSQDINQTTAGCSCCINKTEMRTPIDTYNKNCSCCENTQRKSCCASQSCINNAEASKVGSCNNCSCCKNLEEKACCTSQFSGCCIKTAETANIGSCNNCCSGNNGEMYCTFQNKYTQEANGCCNNSKKVKSCCIKTCGQVNDCCDYKSRFYRNGQCKCCDQSFDQCCDGKGRFKSCCKQN